MQRMRIVRAFALAAVIGGVASLAIQAAVFAPTHKVNLGGLAVTILIVLGASTRLRRSRSADVH